MNTKTLNDLVEAELRELFSTEKQVMKLLPRAAKAAHTGELRETLLARVEEGKQCASRLETVFKTLHLTKPVAGDSELSSMLEGLSKVLTEYGAGNVRDAALIAGMERVEASQAAMYASVRDFTKLLGEDEAVKLIEETLAAGDLTLKKLGQIAIQVNAEAFVDCNSPDCFLKKS